MEVEARGVAGGQGRAKEEISAGETISHYRIIAPLGAGGMMVAVRSALSTATTFPLSGYRFSLAERRGPQEIPKRKIGIRIPNTNNALGWIILVDDLTKAVRHE